MAETVVDGLEVIDVDEQHADVLAALRERLLDAGTEEQPVGHPGEWIVRRLVPQLLLEHGELRQRVLQASALEDDTGLVGEHLEETEVLVIETGDLAEAVGDEHRAHHVVLAAQHHGHRVAQPAVFEKAAGIAVGLAVRAEQQRRVRATAGS